MSNVVTRKSGNCPTAGERWSQMRLTKPELKPQLMYAWLTEFVKQQANLPDRAESIRLLQKSRFAKRSAKDECC
jgi:hypothetical protein